MKNSIRITVLLLVVLVLALPSLAQDRGRPSGGTTSSAGASAGAASSSAGSSRGYVGGVSTSSPGYSEPFRNNSPMASYGSGGSGYLAPAPVMPAYSSFNNSNYYSALNFLNMLPFRYGAFNMLQYNVWDINRFYRNREPFTTPGMLKMTLQQPLKLSNMLLADIEELQAMVNDLQAGKTVPKEQIQAKAQEIRVLARRIREDEAVTFFDLRKAHDVTKDADHLGLEAIAQLREMALDLNTQLRNMYQETSASTVSVNTLNQASFQSLSKGIEKLSKVIENATPRT